MVKSIVELEGDAASSGDGNGLRSRGKVGVASHVVGVDVLNWGVVEGLTNGRVGSAARVSEGGPDI